MICKLEDKGSNFVYLKEKPKSNKSELEWMEIERINEKALGWVKYIWQSFMWKISETNLCVSQ